MLKIKAKSLAEEARIIRREESRCHPDLRWELAAHRTGIVRYEARATYLAYGLLKGKSVAQIETSKTRDERLWKKVKDMIARYGPPSPQKEALLALCKE